MLSLVAPNATDAFKAYRIAKRLRETFWTAKEFARVTDREWELITEWADQNPASPAARKLVLEILKRAGRAS